MDRATRAADLGAVVRGAERDVRRAIRRAQRDVAMATLVSHAFLGRDSPEARQLGRLGGLLRRTWAALDPEETAP